MQFLSDVYLRCPDCDGRRYRDEILEVKIDGRVDRRRARADGGRGGALLPQARGGAATACSRWSTSGLEYLRLGQPVPTLSGGEAQRLKLAGHLAERATSRGRTSCSSSTSRPPACTSTTSRSCCAPSASCSPPGHSLVVIEHNLDVIRASDWIIDLGPEGGDAGGEIVCEGTPAEVMAATRRRTPARRCASTRKPVDAAPSRASQGACAAATSATRSASTTRASTT